MNRYICLECRYQQYAMEITLEELMAIVNKMENVEIEFFYKQFHSRYFLKLYWYTAKNKQMLKEQLRLFRPNLVINCFYVQYLRVFN